MLADGDDSDADLHGATTPDHARAASATPAAVVAEEEKSQSPELRTLVTNGLVGWAAGVLRGPTPKPRIQGIECLKNEKATLRAERKRVWHELKDSEKRRTRLKTRARSADAQHTPQTCYGMCTHDYVSKTITLHV